MSRIVIEVELPQPLDKVAKLLRVVGDQWPTVPTSALPGERDATLIKIPADEP